MATRHIRRLQEAQQAALADKNTAEADDIDAEEEEEDVPSISKPFNPFDLLSDEEEVDAKDYDHESDEEASENRAAAASHPQASGKPQGKKEESKKKKKKKGKSKNKGGNDQPEDADTQGHSNAAEKDVDIDSLVQELKLTTVGDGASSSKGAVKSSAAQSAGLPPLLGVDVKRLKGDDELRRIFGHDVVESVDRADAAEAAATRRGGRRAAPRTAAGRGRTLRSTVLAAPREHWPPLEAGQLGLSVECLGSRDGALLFQYVHSPHYLQLQMYFQQCQNSGDPGQVAALLGRIPFHIDALLSMADLYRHMGENTSSEECLTRALYALELAWGSQPLQVQVASARCRLDWEDNANKPLFIALFRHLQALNRRGCHRSALEAGKMLLSLDPRDPLGVTAMMDYLALRAGQYEFLQRFAAEYDSDKSLPLLPNFAFSLPLAKFRRESAAGAAASTSTQQGGEEEGAGVSGGASSSSHDQLVQAILLHPLVVTRLQAKLAEQGVGADSSWAALLARPLFQSSRAGADSSSLSHLVNLFVERSHLLWKAAEVQSWLKEACQAAADISEGRGAAEVGVSAEDWACVRQETFPDGEVNEYRHLRLHDFTDNVSALPRDQLQAAVAAGGMQEVEDLMAELQEQALLAQQAAADQQRGRVLTEEELRNAHPLVMLLRSLLPWVNVGQEPGANPPPPPPPHH